MRRRSFLGHKKISRNKLKKVVLWYPCKKKEQNCTYVCTSIYIGSEIFLHKQIKVRSAIPASLCVGERRSLRFVCFFVFLFLFFPVMSKY